MSLFRPTVQDVCRKNTMVLEKIKQREERKAAKAQVKLEKVTARKCAAEKQSSMASNAIAKFNEFFGLED